jgi:hypothetical protein
MCRLRHEQDTIGEMPLTGTRNPAENRPCGHKPAEHVRPDAGISAAHERDGRDGEPALAVRRRGQETAHLGEDEVPVQRRAGLRVPLRVEPSGEQRQVIIGDRVGCGGEAGQQVAAEPVGAQGPRPSPAWRHPAKLAGAGPTTPQKPLPDTGTPQLPRPTGSDRRAG